MFKGACKLLGAPRDDQRMHAEQLRVLHSRLRDAPRAPTMQDYMPPSHDLAVEERVLPCSAERH